MAFDLDNYNIAPGSDAAAIAETLDRVVEALSDGIKLSDSTEVLSAVLSITGRLRGKPVAELRSLLVRAAVAVALDELSENGVV